MFSSSLVDFESNSKKAKKNTNLLKKFVFISQSKFSENYTTFLILWIYLLNESWENINMKSTI